MEHEGQVRRGPESLQALRQNLKQNKSVHTTDLGFGFRAFGLGLVV